MATSTRLDTTMAPWICGARRGGSGCSRGLGVPGGWLRAGRTSLMRGCQMWEVLSGSVQLP